jgi:REP element-mobilizing transposase RayT
MASIVMRTPQKRYYINEAVYFVTAVTSGRRLFFREPLFAELFVMDLWFSSRIKEFELYGYTVVPDHVHLMLQPRGSRNISEIMGTLKRNVSRDINDLILQRTRLPLLGGDDSNRPLPEFPGSGNASLEAMQSAHPTLDPAIIELYLERVHDLRTKFMKKKSNEADILRFRWQKSFYDHIIRDEVDFSNHLTYIFANAVKHKLTEVAEDWHWMWVFGNDEPKCFL